MAHKFDSKHMSRLDDPERKIHLPPEEILGKLGLKKGDIFLDIGAGTGYFSFPASAIVGERGKVIAVDVSKEMTDELIARVKSSGKENMKVLQTAEYETGVEPETADIVFLSNVLHEVEDKNKMLLSIRKALKTNGWIGIVEWKKVQTPMGPPLSERMDEKELISFLRTAGFTDIQTADIHGTYVLCSARMTQ